MNKIILIAISIVLTSGLGFGQNIYIINNGDSTLSPKFVKSMCIAARNHLETEPGKPFLLEQLILDASGASFNQENTPNKTLPWHSKFGGDILCESSDKYPAGNFLRQIVYSGYRDFANIIGPKNRLSLNLHQKDSYDSLSMFEFVDKHRIEIEKRHNNNRFEFQQDEEWRNIMFFYFLFSEYKINYDAHLKE